MKRSLFAIAWPLTALLMVATGPWLPEQVGDPGHQAGRNAFVATLLFAVANAGLCSGAFVQWLGRRAPGLISLPHRDYWLAEERRDATLTRLGEHLSGFGLQMLLLLAGIHAYALLEGQPGWPQPPAWAWPAGAVALSLWFAFGVLQTYRLFPAPQRAEAAPLRRPRRPGEHR